LLIDAPAYFDQLIFQTKAVLKRILEVLLATARFFIPIFDLMIFPTSAYAFNMTTPSRQFRPIVYMALNKINVRGRKKIARFFVVVTILFIKISIQYKNHRAFSFKYIQRTKAV